MLQALLINSFFALSTVIASSQLPSEYAYGPDPRHKLDVYLPRDAQDAPMIVMLHGGAWQSGDKRGRNIWHAKVSHWVPEGFVFVSVNTRLRPQADPLEQTQDLAEAMAFIQREARSWGGDADRIFLMGHSAGGHVSLLLAARHDLQREAGVAPWAGTIALDPVALDVQQEMENTPPRWLARAFGEGRERWAARSPLAHLDGQTSPILTICSTVTGSSCEKAERFRDAAISLGIDAENISMPLSHDLTNNLLGVSAEYTAKVDAWIKAR